MLAGHPVLVSLGAVWFRKEVFEKKFREIVQRERERKEKMEGGRLGKALVRRVTFNLALTLTRERSRDGDGDGPSRIPYGGRGDGDVVFGAGSGSGLWFDMKLEIVSG